MKKSEIKSLTVEQLQEKIADTQGQYRRVKFAHSITPSDNPLELRNLRRLVAKLNTELTAKKNAVS
jgi:large subunit ribosomal protein L29